MTPHEFESSLQALGWKQADFCRKTGVSKDTPSRWSAGKTPIQSWVPAYLGAMQDLASLHQKYVAVIAPVEGASLTVDDEAPEPKDLVLNAIAHYVSSERAKGKIPEAPSEELAGVAEAFGRVYIVLRFERAEPVAYRVSDGRNLKRMRRWPVGLPRN